MTSTIPPVDFSKIAPENANGFAGFHTVSALQDARAARGGAGLWGEVPEIPGVYLVLRDPAGPPRFLEQGTGGFFKGEDPNVPIDLLADAWVPHARVVYIGMAGRQTLRRRLRQYVDFGDGKNVGHRGGRYVWQLADAGMLVVCWHPIEGGNPRDVKYEIIQEFKRRYGARPFANLRD